MKYPAPIFENKPQFVPVVAKNVDELIGFLRGVNSYLEVVSETLESVGLDNLHIEVDDADFLDLSSQNFNDVLEDGRRESELSDRELKKYGEKIFADAINNLEGRVADDVKHDRVLAVSCQCNFGHYEWKSYKELPKDSFKCVECGRTLIHYTGHDHYDYDYDEGKE
jgi:ferredoxin-like protein FixX